MTEELPTLHLQQRTGQEKLLTRHATMKQSFQLDSMIAQSFVIMHAASAQTRLYTTDTKHTNAIT